MKSVFALLAALAFVSPVFAADVAAPAKNESVDLTVEGMHCSSCKKMITKRVCDDKDVAAQFESCSVSLVDTEKQIGKITVKMKDGQTLDLAKIEAAVKKAGEDYKVISPVKK